MSSYTIICVLYMVHRKKTGRMLSHRYRLQRWANEEEKGTRPENTSVFFRKRTFFAPKSSHRCERYCGKLDCLFKRRIPYIKHSERNTDKRKPSKTKKQDSINRIDEILPVKGGLWSSTPLYFLLFFTVETVGTYLTRIDTDGIQ